MALTFPLVSPSAAASAATAAAAVVPATAAPDSQFESFMGRVMAHGVCVVRSPEYDAATLRSIAYASIRYGELIAKRAKDAGVESVVFDRGGYKYHGRVKALADGAREGGLNF